MLWPCVLYRFICYRANGDPDLRNSMQKLNTRWKDFWQIQIKLKQCIRRCQSARKIPFSRGRISSKWKVYRQLPRRGCRFTFLVSEVEWRPGDRTQKGSVFIFRIRDRTAKQSQNPCVPLPHQGLKVVVGDGFEPSKA